MKKGIKLDFKSVLVLEESMLILKELEQQVRSASNGREYHVKHTNSIVKSNIRLICFTRIMISRFGKCSPVALI